MKNMLSSKLLPLLTASLGVLALLLRLTLFLVGNDEKGLLIPGHPLEILVWIITLIAAVLTIGFVWTLGGSEKYSDNFSPSAAAAIGAFALAGGIAVAVISGWSVWPRLDLLGNICGLLAIPSLVAVGLIRWQGRRPTFVFHAVVCMYLTIYAISHYQLWSSRPQLQDWFFTMAGSLLLTLFAYYQTAFDVGMGNRRMQLGTGLLGAFFCLSAAAGGEDILLYLGGAVWTLTNLCNLFPVPRRRRNPIPDITNEDDHASA